MTTRREILLGAAAALAACAGGASAVREAERVRRGAVASSQRYASEAGAAILRGGGNAADAAVAMAAALAVTEPTSTGIGGDCFALHFDARTRAITALNGSGRAPAALSIERVRAEGIAGEIPPTHGHGITVPGACAGWCDLAARHGTRSLDVLFEPALALAEEGFAVAPVTAHFWERASERLRSVPGGGELLIEGHAPREGERFRNPGMARTLRAVARGGAEAFYRGEIADAIVAAVASGGGAMTREDLAAHASSWDEPISMRYRGVDVWECPPNGQGITALMALGMLDTLELPPGPLSPERMHVLIEAMRLAFADTRWHVADPRVVPVPIAELLDRAYLRERARLVDPARATADVVRGSPGGHSETVYFCTVDRDGNACSFINSNYTGVGTGIVPSGWGFPLHNRGLNFSLDPAHPNALAAGKRPYHTIMPGMATNADGSLWGPFGVMGGFMQPQGHVQVIVAMLDDREGAQAALDRARFCVDPVDGETSRVLLEEGMPAETVARLEAMGHPITPGIGGFDRSRFGRGQILRVDGDAIDAGSDPRADGIAIGV